MSAASQSNQQPLRINPYTVPPDQQGWRGLELPINAKRKCYTILHNEQVLVTGLILLPGERSIRHSHESGELSVHFSGEMQPMISWNPPGVLHGGPPAIPSMATDIVSGLLAESPNAAADPTAAAILAYVQGLQAQVRQLQEALDELRRPEPHPRILVDILFPPFKTTIDDPVYPEQRTVVGQWYD